MFRAIGFVIILVALSRMMASSFNAFDDAATATFKAVEVAAVVSQQQLIEASQ